MNHGTHKTEVSAFAPPPSDYLGEDPVGARYAAMKRQAFNPATLAHHLGKPGAQVMQVLRNKSDDAALIKLVDCALGLIPTVIDADLLEDTPEEKPVEDMTPDEILAELTQAADERDAAPPVSEDPEYLAELEAGKAEDETLHSLPQEPDYASARTALTLALFDAFRDSGNQITFETIDRDMCAPRGTTRNVLLGGERNAKIEDFVCWLTDMQREQCWPPNAARLQRPWCRIAARSPGIAGHQPGKIARRSKYGPTISPSFAHTTPKGPRT